MGVRGLTRLISEHLENERNVVPPGSTLIVDGNGFLFHVFKTLGDEQIRHLGGKYSSISSYFEGEIASLLSMNLQVLFIMDGKCSILKNDALESRRKDRETEWNNLFTMCRDKKKCSQVSLPIPPLVKDQMMSTLKGMGIDVVTAIHEADTDIAYICSQGNIEGENYFCYGQDSGEIFPSFVSVFHT